MFITILSLLFGLVVLIVGAEGLVRGSSSLAKKMGIAPIVIGLTIVAFGTSAPELTVNVYSALQGNTAIAIGNVVGSNIANILLILGISACISPLTVNRNTAWKEIPLAFLAVGLIFIMGNDQLFDGEIFNVITRSEGLVLIAIFAIFLHYTYSIAKSQTASDDSVTEYGYGRSVLFTLGGLGLLILGGRLLVDGAVSIATQAGLSQSLISLTIVAVGTSLPELATSAVAAFRKQSDIAIGNVVGSNIFNVFWILGFSSILAPHPFTSGNSIDILVAILATLGLFAALFIGHRYKVQRWQGVIFIISYVVYIAYLITQG